MTAVSGLSLWTGKPAAAQITELRNYHGKKIYCTLSGLRGFSSECGIINDYEYIFIGSVLSVAQISDEEKRLQLQPLEIFLGNPLDQLTVTTNQGDCLQEIEPGDEWLVYLFRDSKTNGLVLEYGSPSAPVAESTETVALLRRLSQMTNSGVIIGDVQDKLLQDDHHGLRWTEFLNVPNHQVVAKRLSDGTEYSALTNSAGHYEFQELPSGSYHLSANANPGLWAEEGDTDVSKGSCTEIQFQLIPNGKISGHVTQADGKPLDLMPSVEI